MVCASPQNDEDPVRRAREERQRAWEAADKPGACRGASPGRADEPTVGGLRRGSETRAPGCGQEGKASRDSDVCRCRTEGPAQRERPGHAWAAVTGRLDLFSPVPPRGCLGDT